MKFNRVANSETARKTMNELIKIPQKLIDLTTDFGIGIYCFDQTLYPSWIGLFENIVTLSHNRSIDNTACFSPYHKSIILYDWDFDESEYGYSTTIHEYAHALDYVLGSKIRKNSYFSEINIDILKGWNQQKGLDWYANRNPHEYFAQAFMAYLYGDKEKYKPKIYFEHTRQELKLKDPDMYYILKNIIE